MKFGNLCGCHQKPERSFFVKGYQFPVCARCFGVWVGYIVGLLLFNIYTVSIFVCIISIIIMFIDWFLQYKKIIISNNIRRFITGTTCGYGLINLTIKILNKINS